MNHTTPAGGPGPDTGGTGGSRIPLSVLDLTVVGENGDPAAALRRTASLAQAVESWGYRRFWVAEHHSFPASGSPAPAVLLAFLADRTRTIRLGSGGVMLTNHAPLVVAEQFGVLNAFHPGRIDLGVGRNPGGLPAVEQALRRAGHGKEDGADDQVEDGGAHDRGAKNDRAKDGGDFADQVEELLGFLADRFPADHPYARDHVHVVPKAPELPVWALGSGTTGAVTAARLGLPFAAAFHINPGQALKAIDLYRSTFRPSATLPEPHVMVSVNATCAPTAAGALRLARSGALMMMRARQGRQSALPSADTAARHPYTPEEREFVDGWLGGVVHGAPDAVHAGLTDLQIRTGADELMLTTMIHDDTARALSYALVAREFGLAAGADRPCPTGEPTQQTSDGGRLTADM
ncbi:luciferase family oxidoreductase, group 1 [Actinacidiphila yanglinensis]|uniref:Luciferase family oxidoreductase, group 1 n=1 Tax=Actinacidiphila yanglinensis TaxID=310779 RepID=A0A1H6E2Y6_9ACTN|nr:LLM class flavin-dependent oxidoreductase [Actinacidiphila yanglinensis]SEG92068.1 luciferase family oxidoreductase, group 1 [Actinacidiphila yanglinensis]